MIGRELRSLSLYSSLGDYSNDGFQFSKWRPDLLFGVANLLFLFYFLE